MTEIIFKLKDDLVREYGELYIKELLEKQLEFLSFRHTMDKIAQQIKESHMDYEKELETIRQKAWNEYKEDFIH